MIFSLTKPRRLKGSYEVKRRAKDMSRAVFQPQTHFLYYHLSGRRKMAFQGREYILKPDDCLLFYAGEKWDSWPADTDYQAINATFLAARPNSRLWRLGLATRIQILLFLIIIVTVGNILRLNS